GTPAPQGMETLRAVSERTAAFVRDCCARRDTVLISTHAIAMKGILESFTPGSNGSYWSKYIGNCAVYAMEWTEEDGFSVPVEIRLE
ncbi:MAG: histidine phosphatase family protein, partial [Clostridia bacterium]|nr:histidine phosphatase family protein [Clostridia bacterium]